MMLLNSNKQKMYYALLNQEVPIYERDEFGNIKYIEIDGEQVPVESGMTELGFSEPVQFLANISFGGSEITAQEFGVNLSDYDATMVLLKNEIPITETSIIWYESEPLIVNGVVDKNSADYSVIAVKPTLNEVKYLLKHLVK